MSAFGSINFQTANGAGGGTTLSFAAISTAANDLISVGVAWSNPAVTITSVTDTIGNTYVSRVSIADTAGGASVQFWDCISSSGTNASNVIVIHFSGAGATHSSAVVYDVPVSGGFVAVHDASAPGNAALSNTPSSGSFNTTGTDEIVFGIAENEESNTLSSAGGGFTIDTSGFGIFDQAAIHNTYTTTQSGLNPSGTLTGGNSFWAMVAESYKAVSSTPASSGVVVVIMD